MQHDTNGRGGGDRGDGADQLDVEALRMRSTQGCLRSFILAGGAMVAFLGLAYIGLATFVSQNLRLKDGGQYSSVTPGTGLPTAFNLARPTGTGTLAVGLDQRVTKAPLTAPWTPADHLAGSAIFEPLATLGPRGVVPLLAASIEPSPDLRRWRITMVRNVRFHDGTALDGAAVAANLEAARAHPRFAPALAPITSITAEGLTVVVELAAPWVTFPAVLTSQVGYIAQPSTVATAGSPDPVLIGTGPFKIGERDDRRLRVDRNADYRIAGQPNIDRIDFHVVPAAEQTTELLNGDLDLVLSAEPTVIEQAVARSRDDRTQVVFDPSARVELLALNARAGALTDGRRREAVDLAIDRAAFEVDRGAPGLPSGTMPAAASVPGAPVGAPAAPDRARAIELLRASAGEPPGSEAVALHLRLTVGTGGPGEESRALLHDAQFVQVQLHEVGIEVEIHAVDAEEVPTVLAQGSSDLVLALMPVPADPDGWQPWLRSATPGAPAVNGGFVGSAALDRELDARRATLDVPARTEATSRIDDLVRADRSYLWLQERPAALIATPRVTGLAGLDARGFFTGGVRPWATSVGKAPDH